MSAGNMDRGTNRSSGALPLREVAVRLRPEDSVAIAKVDLQVGITMTMGKDPSEEVTVRQLIPSGHKVALRDLGAGEPVYRYGQVIGHASRPISSGEHVHVHNLARRK